MSRIDQHIDSVRTRFLIQKLAHYAAWTITGVCVVMFLLVALSRFFAFSIPPMLLLVAGGVALVCLISLILAAATSPSRHATAVKIDEVLGLKERYSTALYARGNSDVFAQAAVTDAEHTANMTSIRKRFPMQLPRMALPAMGAMLAVFLVDRYLPQMDLFGREEKAKQQLAQQQKAEQARELAKKALAEVASIPKVSGEAKNLEAARRQLDELIKNPVIDPTEVTITAQRAMQQAEAARNRIEDMKATAERIEQSDVFRPLSNTSSGGVYEDFKKSIAENKFDKAQADIKAALDKFGKADAATQDKMAADMKQVADQLAQIANDPAVAGQIQKQLEQAGASREQAQQMVKEMQKAAAGDRNAQNRVNQMAENLARKMNGGVLPAPDQLASLMQQVQQQQNRLQAQQNAQQMASAANKMASAMQNAAAQNKQQAQQGQQANQQGGKPQGQQANQGNQGNQNQQANSQQGGQQQQQQGGNASNQQQSGQGQQQTASQQGGQSGGDQQQGNPGQSQMADAQQQMNDALNQAQGNQNETGGSMAGEGGGEGEGESGQWAAGGDQGQGGQGGKGMGEGFSGPNMGGIGAGPRPGKRAAPYVVKKEVDKGEADNKGKVLSSSFVKADSIRGESKEQLKEILKSAQKDVADDVEPEQVPMQAREVVKRYYESMQQDMK